MRKILCAANHYDDGKEHTHMPRNISSGFVVCGEDIIIAYIHLHLWLVFLTVKNR